MFDVFSMFSVHLVLVKSCPVGSTEYEVSSLRDTKWANFPDPAHVEGDFCDEWDSIFNSSLNYASRAC